MRILLVSDSPLTNSAYATQATLLAQALVEAGHTLLFYSYTYIGMPLTLGLYQLVGCGNPGNGEAVDLLLHYAAQFRPDIILSYKDAYAFPPRQTAAWPVPWVALAPVDSTPANLQTIEALKQATAVITFTENGRQALEMVNIAAEVCPPAINTTFFSPGESDFRQKHGINPDALLAVVVAANQDPEDRKNHKPLLLAWQRFIAKTDPEAVLVLHTDASPRGAVNIGMMAEALDFNNSYRKNLRVSNPDQYAAGYDSTYVRDLLRAADVNLALGNEGFGCPVVEAAACGTPSLAIWVAGLQNSFCGGWVLDARDETGNFEWTKRGALWFRPSSSAIANGLAQVKAERPTLPELPERCREAALRFDHKTVLENHWLPTIAKIERRLQEGILE